MADKLQDLESLREGYSKALTFWQSFVNPQQPIDRSGDQNFATMPSNVKFTPGGNVAVDEYMPASDQVTAPPQAAEFSSEYAAELAKAQRHAVNVNPAVLLPQYYGNQIAGLPPMPYLLPPSEQIYRPVQTDLIEANSAAARGSLAATSTMVSSALEQRYLYRRATQDAWTGAFGIGVPKILTDILAFGAGSSIAKSIVKRSVLGSIPGLSGILTFGGEMIAGMGLSYLAAKPIEMIADAIKLHNERAEAAEQLTKEFVIAGSELSPLGRGLSAGSASRLGYSMMRITERMGMASYRDVEEILKLGGAGGLFMMDQNLTGIEQKLRGLIKVFGEISKITNDPDMRKHIQNIAEFYKFGGGMEHFVAATEFAGMGSRVTGLSAQQMMSTYGAMGMNMFQGMGLVPAYGAIFGIQARTSTQLAVASGAFSKERLALLGGVEGVTASIMGGQIAGAGAFTNFVLPSLVYAGPGGTMGVSPEGAMAAATSQNPLYYISRQPGALAAYAKASGQTMAQALQDYNINKNLLQSEVLKNNPLFGQVSMVNMANQITRMTGGQVKTEQALMMLGVDQNTAISMTRTFGDVNSLNAIRRQAEQQLIEMGQRTFKERRAMVSSLGLGFQLGVMHPLEELSLLPGRAIHENIVTPYRIAAQRAALEGTPARLKAVAESELDYYSEPGAFSRFLAKPFTTERARAGVELVEGRGLFNTFRNLAFEHPVLAGILGAGAIVGGTLLALPVGAAVAATAGYIATTTPSEGEALKQSKNLLQDVELTKNAKMTSTKTYDATEFLRGFEEGKYKSLHEFVAEKYKVDPNSKEGRTIMNQLTGSMMYIEKNYENRELKTLVANYFTQKANAGKYMADTMADAGEKARAEIADLIAWKYTKTTRVDTAIRGYTGSTTYYTYSIAGVDADKFRRWASTQRGEKIKALEKLMQAKEGTDEYQEALSKLQELSQVGEHEMVKFATAEDYKIAYKALKEMDSGKAMLGIRAAMALSRSGADEEDIKKYTSAIIDNKIDKMQEMADRLKKEAGLSSEHEKKLQETIGTMYRDLREGKTKKAKFAGMVFAAEDISDENLFKTKATTAYLSDKIIRDVQEQATKSMAPGPSATSPGGSAEGINQLIKGIDELIKAASSMKKAAQTIEEAKKNT